jgi:HEAT repeat protein
MPLNKSQIAVTRVLVLIVCLGLIAWMWRQSERSRGAPTVKTWVEKLQSGDSDERKYAIQELSSAGDAEADSVAPALVAALHDRESSVRNEAVLALGRYVGAAVKKRGTGLADQGRAAAAGLLELITSDGDDSVRASAAYSVASLHSALADSGVKPDRSRAEDPIDPKIMAKAFNTFLEGNPANRLAILVPYLSLGPIGEPAPAALLATLDDPSPEVRKAALQVLCQFTTGSDRAVPVLLKEAELKAPPSGLQVAKGASPGSALHKAADGLHPTAAVVPMLAKALESENPDVRRVAVLLLGRVGPDARSASPTLIAKANDLMHSKAGEASAEGPGFGDYASAIAQILPAAEAVSILSPAIAHEERGIRTAAATALGKLGPNGNAAVPILLKALKTAGTSAGGRGEASYTTALVQSLSRIAPGASLPKPMADEVIEALCPYLETSSASLRNTAAKALGDFGPRAAGALPKLKALAGNEKAAAATRQAAADAIEKIEPATEKKEPATEKTEPGKEQRKPDGA